MRFRIVDFSEWSACVYIKDSTYHMCNGSYWLTFTNIGKTSFIMPQLRIIVVVTIGLSIMYNVPWKKRRKKNTTRMGFEPTRAEHNGLAVHRLNHSATSSNCHYQIYKAHWCSLVYTLLL